MNEEMRNEMKDFELRERTFRDFMLHFTDFEQSIADLKADICRHNLLEMELEGNANLIFSVIPSLLELLEELPTRENPDEESKDDEGLAENLGRLLDKVM